MNVMVAQTLKQLVGVMAAVAIFSTYVLADTYRWVDDKGVVHFTDNPERIPAKYLKWATSSSESEPSEVSSGSGQPASSPQQQLRQSQNAPGPLNEQEWRSRFSSLRAEIKALQNSLPDKRDALDQLRRKRIIYQRTQDRVAYNDLNEKLERDEARIVELQAQLNGLEIEASRAGVPLEWRQ